MRVLPRKERVRPGEGNVPPMQAISHRGEVDLEILEPADGVERLPGRIADGAPHVHQQRLRPRMVRRLSGTQLGMVNGFGMCR